jgi:hypothetical protein
MSGVELEKMARSSHLAFWSIHLVQKMGLHDS